MKIVYFGLFGCCATFLAHYNNNVKSWNNSIIVIALINQQSTTIVSLKSNYYDIAQDITLRPSTKYAIATR